MLPYFEPIDEVTSYRLPKNRWKYYENWDNPPTGFIAMAAATCVFNPNMGQGMSVAAGDAGILKKCLRDTTSLAELPKRFFAEQAHFQKNAYELACRNDLKFRAVVGKRDLRTRVFNWYTEQVTHASACDSWIARESGLVNLLIEPINRMYKPWFMLRVLFARLFLWWQENPARDERVAPIPPDPAEIPRRWRSTAREGVGIVYRFTRTRLGLSR